MHLVETWCPSIGLRKNLEVSLCKFFKAVTVVFLFLFWHFFFYCCCMFSVLLYSYFSTLSGGFAEAECSVSKAINHFVS